MIKLLYGDCIEKMTSLPDECIDLVLCDPPYGTTRCKWDAVIPFEEMWEQLNRVSKKNAAFVFTTSQPFTSAMVMSNVKNFKCEWIWEKNAGSNFGAVKYQPMKEHETVLVFSRKTSIYNPIMQERAASGLDRVKHNVNYNTKTELVSDTLHNEISSKRPELRYPRSIQKFNRERGLHPTQKPVDLMRYLIRTYSNEENRVLDFTMGSGTTGVACKLENRKFIGIENDENYFNIAKKRIEEA